MSDESPTRSEAVPKIWRYMNGDWVRIDDPTHGVAPDDDWDEALKALGYSPSPARWGWPHLPTVDIWEHDTERERWLVEWEPADSRCYLIEVRRLPDLLDLRAKLAAITTADLLTALLEHLEDLVSNAAEDGRRERRRRV